MKSNLLPTGKSGTIIALIFLLLFTFFGSIYATNYYVDPVNGSMVDDGSMEDPWKTLAEVFSQNITFEAGDTIFLLNGHHGSVIIKGVNSDYVTILPMEGDINIDLVKDQDSNISGYVELPEGLTGTFVWGDGKYGLKLTGGKSNINT